MTRRSGGRRTIAVGACLLLASVALGSGSGMPSARASSASGMTRTRAVAHEGSSATASPRAVLFAYYYIWFSHNSWRRAKTDLPLIGGYDSSNRTVIRHQIQQAKSAGIGGFIVSWKDTPLNDSRLESLMTVAAQEHFKLAMIYEGLDFQRKPLAISTVVHDFVMFRDKYASNPAWFRVAGKPLTIWSGTWAFSYDQVAQVTSAVRPGMLVLSTEKDLAGFDRLAAITDGDAYYWSSVNPAIDSGYRAKLDQMSQAIHAKGEYWIAPFAPGFDARLLGGQRNVPRDNGQTLRTEYAVATESQPDMLGLISWNEFSENTYVEPSHNYGYQALDVLRQMRSGASGPPSGSAAPDSGAAARANLSPWPNVLLLSGFMLALVVAAGCFSYARRRLVSRRSMQEDDDAALMRMQ
jgi:hypothetical protein